MLRESSNVLNIFSFYIGMYADFLNQVYLCIYHIVRGSPAALMRSTEHMNRARVSDGFIIAHCPAHFNRELRKTTNLHKELCRKFRSYLMIFHRNSLRRRKDTGQILNVVLSTSGLHYEIKYWSTSSEHRPNCLTYTIVRSNVEPVTSFGTSGRQ